MQSLSRKKYQALAHASLAPLKYRLSSILFHQDLGQVFGEDLDEDLEIQHCQWMGSVRGPEHVYNVNDHAVTQVKPSHQLCKNPQNGMQAVVLVYQGYIRKRFDCQHCDHC